VNRAFASFSPTHPGRIDALAQQIADLGLKNSALAGRIGALLRRIEPFIGFLCLKIGGDKAISPESGGANTFLQVFLKRFLNIIAKTKQIKRLANQLQPLRNRLSSWFNSLILKINVLGCAGASRGVK